ncbi:MAG: carbohydrate kinase family protein [Lachnospiraceae bacterium]|nr:carbohydrate kinase family protein [Lachnospiraceae bacterium]
MNKCQILCIGTALIDSVIRGFDREPVSAAGFVAKSGELFAGGEAVNVSVAAAKLGAQAGICCRLGEDAAGDLILKTLTEGGVDTSRVLRTKDVPTPVTTIFVDEEGERKSVTNTAHRYNFHPEHAPECLKGAKAAVIGSLFRAPFNDPAVVRDVLQILHQEGSLIFADTKLPNFQPLTLEDIAPYLQSVDFITPNETEAYHFTGKQTPEEAAEVLLRCGVKNVVIKLGGKGCYFRSGTREIRIPAYCVNAVDATGAGDNFLAGLITEILRGAKVEDALRFACACGAICTTKTGAGEALTGREQVVELMGSDSGSAC